MAHRSKFEDPYFAQQTRIDSKRQIGPTNISNLLTAIQCIHDPVDCIAAQLGTLRCLVKCGFNEVKRRQLLCFNADD
ncbi:hypothetical protein M7I_6712 [Glarea lozoyensis 74030]|uniref:Uncharacterized protein n=1 Tax=Glarea lozoyensis (strain ATCC 74030 / MF5533) TaxID=1104152 RepID=H0EVB7_GLAL7|nr:hypothetical protein M7I_6712 [Glarea lozoyensis 74030]